MSDDRTPARGRLREHVAEEIRVLLARKRMSGIELGRRIGMKQSTISRRLTGETAFDMDDIEAIADALGVDVSDLMPKTAKHGQRGENLSFPRLTVPASPDAERPIGISPFGGGRRDSARPTSAIPASKRRPARKRSSNRPGLR
jgi:transcriptional regulator with XRE-family HTH domain